MLGKIDVLNGNIRLVDRQLDGKINALHSRAKIFELLSRELGKKTILGRI